MDGSPGGNHDQMETGLPPMKHEDLPRIVQQKIAAELTRIRFELSALRKALKVGWPRE